MRVGKTSVLTGLAVAAFGVAVAAGFFGHFTGLMQTEPGRDASMSLESAAALVLGGVALALAGGRRGPRRWSLGLGCALGALSLGTLAENVFDLNLGMDWPARYAWLRDPALRPGRMAPNAAIGFLVLAAILLTLPWVRSRRAGRAIRWLTIALALVGVSGLAGYFVHIEAMVTVHGFAAMAPYTAIGLIALAFGTWRVWAAKRWNRSAPGQGASSRVMATAAAVLIAVVAAAGVSSFVLLWHLTERDATEDLSLRRDQRIRYVEQLTANDLNVNQQFVAQAALLWPKSSRAGLPPALAVRGFTSARLLTPSGAALAGFGHEVQPAVSMQISERTWLLWSNGFYLRQSLPVIADGRLLGTVVIEQPEPLMHSIGTETTTWGATGEMELCGRLPQQDGRAPHELQCFPQRLRPEPFRLSAEVNGVERPIALALSGQIGVMQAPDYRSHRALAAYAPVPGLRLGLVIKMDTTEVFASNLRQLEIMLPLLILLVVAGLELLRWQVRPLLRELVGSRNQAQASEARFRAAAESGMDPFYIFESQRDPVHGAIFDFQLVYANHPGEVFADLETRHIPGMGLSSIPQLAQASGFLEKFSRVVGSRSGLEEEFALAALDHSANGEPARWVHLQAVPLGDGVAVTLRDISVRKWEEERLIALSQSDPLTGLANRTAFRQRLMHAMEASRRLRRQAVVAVLFLDIDYFKRINDTLGHAVGDQVLIAFAARLQNSLRSADTVARPGGDEFTVLIENLEGAADAERVVAAIFAAMQEPIRADGRAMQISTSIGLALYRGEEITADELLRRADNALYTAKRGGRNQHHVATY
ncbi:MAG TPA: GGDEF domain-containing protein [Terriglobales bacterium]|nr:GGDEF domain-containing protein [Terriglobales bacterium]